MDPERYSEFANSLQNFASQFGASIDTNFFRWQMSDVFVAPLLAEYLDHRILDDALTLFPDGEIKDWMEKHREAASALTVGAFCAVYEVMQAIEPGRTLDVHDLVAYTAGLLMYMGRRSIFDGYANLREKITDIPEFMKQAQVMLREHATSYIENIRDEIMAREMQSGKLTPFFSAEQERSLGKTSW
jgi:hypothetical protein